MPITEVEGPGRRAALWVQGCRIGCAGCCNPEMLDPAGGYDEAVERLAEAILPQPALEGITLLGGEPLDQPEELAAFCALLRRTSSLGIILFTGYRWEDVVTTAHGRQIRDLVDLIIAGPHRQDLTPDPRRWIGSRNQTIHACTERYRTLVEAWPAARMEIEIHLADGEWIINGTPHHDRLRNMAMPDRGSIDEKGFCQQKRGG
jgi:anaerobic ribonucleoside-triphosphate reductase activating protein